MVITGIRVHMKWGWSGCDSSNTHGWGCYTAQKSMIFSFFSHDTRQVFGRYLWGLRGNKKNDTWHFGKQNAHRGGNLFPKMSWEFLSSVNVPPNSLWIWLQVFMKLEDTLDLWISLLETNEQWYCTCVCKDLQKDS
jgi:hypothetical protein